MAVTEAVRPKLTSRLRTGSALLGPAFVAAIAYVDPGNVASNISAGARYGYLLVWVIVAANLMAVLVQYLSAKLGLVTGTSLPEALRARLSRPARLAYWPRSSPSPPTWPRSSVAPSPSTCCSTCRSSSAA